MANSGAPRSFQEAEQELELALQELKQAIERTHRARNHYRELVEERRGGPPSPLSDASTALPPVRRFRQRFRLFALATLDSL